MTTTRPAADRPTMDRPAIEPVWEAEPARDGVEPAGARGGIGERLAERYGGDLWIPLRTDRPTLVANFVETLDGVVSMDAADAGGAEVSGHNRADRFVLALLRALADAVVVGAGVLRNSSGPRTPALGFPAAADDFAALRQRLGLPPEPTLIVLTSSGDVDLDHPALRDPAVPVVIAGPPAARDRVTSRGRPPAHVRLDPLGGRSLGEGLAGIVRGMGGRLAVSEAGPHVTGQLVADGFLDELFLTVAPQLAGRSPATHRLALLEGVALWPDAPRWLQLRSVRRAEDHLFLRYAFGDRGHGD